MIPTPQRLRTNRLWSAAAASLAALAAAAAAWSVLRGREGLFAAGLAGALAWLAVYRLGTRIWRRRLKVLARPFPAAWEGILTERVAFYAALTDAQKARFRKLVAIFLDETPITAAGCEADEACHLLVAASAVIPIFALRGWEYRHLREVVVRGEQFDFLFPGQSNVTTDIQGLVGNTGGAFHGTMVLSKADLIGGFEARGGKHHVGIHEFAHLIDKADGAVDGVPASLPPECLQPWLRLVRAELDRAWGGWSDIPEYAFTNEQEFFAVASEYFFQSPDELAANHPELYEILQRVFRQNMRARLGRLVRRRRRPRGAP